MSQRSTVCCVFDVLKAGLMINLKSLGTKAGPLVGETNP